MPDRPSSDPALSRGMILVVGPDGSGKSTIADAIAEDLEGLGVEVSRAHHRPSVLIRRTSTGPVTEPHSLPVRGPFTAVVKLGVVFVDYLIGRFGKWRRWSKRGVLLLERGWFDQAVDPLRYRLPPYLIPVILFLGRFTPKADIVVLLTGDPAEMHRRKPELSISEVDRQINAWRSLAARSGSLVVEWDTTTTDDVGISANGLLDRVRPSLRHRSWRRIPMLPRRLEARTNSSSPSLEIYQPLTSRARIARMSSLVLMRAGVGTRCEAPLSGIEGILATLDLPSDDVVAFRSTAPGRWLLGVADGGHHRHILKLGSMEDGGLRREARTLEFLQSIGGPVRPPKLLQAVEVDSTFTLVMVQESDLILGAVDLDELADITSSMVSGSWAGRPVCHGDFTPWNVGRAGDGSVVIIDWEEANWAYRPLYDLAHYAARQGAFLGAGGPASVVRLLTEEGSPGWRHLKAIGEDPRSAAALVVTYLDELLPDSKRHYRDRLRHCLQGQ